MYQYNMKCKTYMYILVHILHVLMYLPSYRCVHVYMYKYCTCTCRFGVEWWCAICAKSYNMNEIFKNRLWEVSSSSAWDWDRELHVCALVAQATWIISRCYATMHTQKEKMSSSKCSFTFNPICLLSLANGQMTPSSFNYFYDNAWENTA